ncbi:alpha-amylase family glycosyl hydrolase [Spirosoma sordidisoli]|uniref:alpha-amylase family glycosyl hydrolase n=1 Tax=Spirosoma sordidisoli TaxID=2502893 RepID=UPI001F0E3C60|nr:alpha-amylase family glycosyl hydrolase [Spirosoma sordidisoli]
METMGYKDKVIYQIYPRSFADANGDGIGDLRGITRKLDYLVDLGVDILWISPVFQSPNADNGYDISDYEAIMPEFGTMADFDELLAQAHNRGLKIVLDLVVNHSSDEHRWFQESRKSKDNPYRDYYIWRPAGMINNWQSFFSGSVWTYDAATDEYYLHLFAEKQPDLNWENPALRQAIYRMMRFWLDKGVDGFRMDVIPFLSKDPLFPDYPAGRFGDLTIHANGPRIHEFLQEMHREVLAHYPDVITIGEGFGVSAEQANLYVGEARQELNMIYHFDHAVPREEYRFLDPAPEFTLPQLKAVFAKWNVALASGPDAPGWQNIYFGNHDNPRCLSRFGNVDRYHYESATMLATVLLTQRGTPSIYQGDEIGMTNCPFDSIDEYDDIQVKNAWQALVEPGKGGLVAGGPDSDELKSSASMPTRVIDRPDQDLAGGGGTSAKLAEKSGEPTPYEPCVEPAFMPGQDSSASMPTRVMDRPDQDLAGSAASEELVEKSDASSSYDPCVAPALMPGQDSSASMPTRVMDRPSPDLAGGGGTSADLVEKPDESSSYDSCVEPAFMPGQDSSASMPTRVMDRPDQDLAGGSGTSADLVEKPDASSSYDPCVAPAFMPGQHSDQASRAGRFLATANRIARDHARTPMQWSGAANAGFTEGEQTWLKVNPNYKTINVANQARQDRSVLTYYRQLLRLRKQTPALHTGSYQDWLPEHPTVWVYERRLGDEVRVVWANFSDQPVAIDRPSPGPVILSNYPDTADVLRPFEARLYHA